MNDRRRLMMPNKTRLPSEYREVEWLENTGMQQIDTRLLPAPMRVQHRVIFTKTVYDTFQFMGINDTRGQHWGIYNNRYTLEGGILAPQQYSPTVWRDIEFIIMGSDRGGTGCILNIDDITIRRDVTSNYQYDTYKLFRSTSAACYCKIAEVSILYNGNRSMKLIPCYRKSDNKPGMYDLVSGSFLVNSGTGEFTIGPEV